MAAKVDPYEKIDDAEDGLLGDDEGGGRKRLATQMTEMSAFDVQGAEKYQFLEPAENMVVIYEGLDCFVDVEVPEEKDPTKMEKKVHLACKPVWLQR